MVHRHTSRENTHTHEINLKMTLLFMHVYVWACSWKPEEGFKYPRTEVTGSCEPTDVGAEVEPESSRRGTSVLSHLSNLLSVAFLVLKTKLKLTRKARCSLCNAVGPQHMLRMSSS